MPSTGYVADTFVAGEQPTTAKWNELWGNDASFNSGNGFNDAILLARHFGANQINQGHIDWTTTTPGGIWWQELGRTTLGSAANTISLSLATTRKYLRIYIFTMPSGGSTTIQMKLNSDAGSNYAYRYADNGAAETTTASSTALFPDTGGGNYNVESFIDVVNVDAREKILSIYSVGQNTSGAANAPVHRVMFGKWANTAAQINRIDLNTPTNNYAAGSELVVLGHD